MSVSRAINGKPGVSDSVRKSIISIANEIGYHPNQIARGLATSNTTTIGLVVPDNTNPFFANIARGVEDTAYNEKYNIFLVNTAEEPAREKAALRSLSQKGVDGLILCSSRLPIHVMEQEINRFPAVVLLNREMKRPPAHTVTININDQRGAQLAIGYLLANGRSRIAYLDGPPNSTSAKRRLMGYRSALQEANIPFDRQMVESCAPDTAGGRTAAAALLARCPGIDSIYAYNDLVAVGAIQIVEETKKRVPEDIAIIGFDDIPLASIVRPQITTLHVDLRHIGRLAMRTLLDIIEGKSTLTSITIDPQLIVRMSA